MVQTEFGFVGQFPKQKRARHGHWRKVVNLAMRGLPKPLIRKTNPGVVVFGTEDEPVAGIMRWGFHRPFNPSINNTRTDKLDGPTWKQAFRERRCLIPVSRFAEAEGEKGAKTRTWFALPDEPLFAVAGLWRDTDEWGRAYTMVMTEACIHVAQVHDRMPVILRRDDWNDWLDGAPDDARLLCRPYPELMVVERTSERWSAR